MHLQIIIALELRSKCSLCFILQPIRYALCCSHYDDSRYRHKCMVDRFLSKGYTALRLEKSFKKFYGRYSGTSGEGSKSICKSGRKNLNLH